MKKLILIALGLIILVVFQAAAFALPMKIGICPSLMQAAFGSYLPAHHGFEQYDLDTAYGLNLSLAYPLSEFMDLQAGGTYYAGAKLKSDTMGGATAFTSDIYLNLRLTGAALKSLCDFEPYCGIGLNYGFVTTKNAPEEIVIHGNIGYQIFMGGYIAGQYPIEIGFIHLNFTSPVEDFESPFVMAPYIKGGYSFNL